MMIIRMGAAIALVSAACGKVEDKDPPPDLRQTVVELPATPNRDLDLLFVVDDSPTTNDLQLKLASSFPSFLDRLQLAPGGLPNLHLGVVTSDMGTKASGSPTPAPSIGQIGQGGCGGTGKGGALQPGNAPVTGQFLRDVDAAGGGRTRNYTGTLAEAFGAMARVGGGGCGFEQPLAAMRAALDDHPSNAGFLRPDALLGVVIFTDEDDCSAKSTSLFGPQSPALGPLQSFRCTRFGVTCAQGGQTPDEMNEVGAKGGCVASPSSDLIDEIAPYREFLLGLKPDPRSVVVAGILGPPEPFAVELRAAPGGGTPEPALTHACMNQGPSTSEIADPAVRIQDFLGGFPERSAATSICQPDLSNDLAQLANLFRKSLGSPCVEDRLADADPDAAGLQPDCVVEDLIGASAIELASCEARPDARPCWRLEADPAACTGPANLKLVVQRAAAPDPATVTRMRCAVEP